MNIIVLSDIESNVTNAVIIAEESTGWEVGEAIAEAKLKEDYQWEDLLEALPKDCKVYSGSQFEEVWY